MLRSTVTPILLFREIRHSLSPERKRYQADYRNLPIAVGSALLIVLAGCAGYMPGRQAYWDARVREMCEIDGGVTIIQRLRVARADIDNLGTVGGKIGVPIKELAHPDAPAYATHRRTVLAREGTVTVGRLESSIVRRSDQALLAKWVAYSRTGGDAITGISHETTFSCPDVRTITSDLQQLFIVEGEQK